MEVDDRKGTEKKCKEINERKSKDKDRKKGKQGS